LSWFDDSAGVATHQRTLNSSSGLKVCFISLSYRVLIFQLFDVKDDYGPVTSTTRKPTSESGQFAKRKNREADRQDELS
jgi:hypothetical protein